MEVIFNLKVFCLLPLESERW